MNNKLNIFKKDSSLHPFRWFIISGICISGLMVYADVAGWRLLSASNQQEWSPGNPGSHGAAYMRTGRSHGFHK